ncbi:MAG: glycosyltransferase [Parabacteroides sp.]|nr:glycosyltransferase [Parabacteroides sp.]
MYNIIRYIDFSRFEVSIITLIPEKKNSRKEEFQKFPVSIVQLCKEQKTNPVQLFLSLKKKVKELNPDMLHAHCSRSLYLMNFLPKKYKKIYTIHIYPGLQQQILYGRLKGDLIIWLNNYFTRKTDMPVGCAESVSKLYKKYKNWDIKSIPNGCSLPVWKYDQAQKLKLKQELGLDINTRYFIFIGRFSQEKRPEQIIKAFNAIKDEQEHTGLIMLGTGPMWNDLKQKNKEIIMPGFKTNIYDYLIASDYYISASDVEGLPNTLLESMTVGLPMLLSDIPAHNEVLSKMSDSAGFLFDSNNIDDLINKMKMLIVSDKDNIRTEIKETFEKYYTAKIMSESYQQAYISVIS